MPAKKPRRCTFLVGGRPCSREGEGNPPLCEKHEAAVYGDEPTQGEEILDNFLDDFADNPQVQDALGRMSGFIDRFAHLVDRVSAPKERGDRRAAVQEAWTATRATAQGAWEARRKPKMGNGHSEAPHPPKGAQGQPGWASRGAQTPPRPRQAPPPRQPPPPKPRPAPDKIGPARVVMGFPASLKLTPELIKERRKQLALIFHPDRGGSPDGMSRLNASADVLLEACKAK